MFSEKSNTWNHLVTSHPIFKKKRNQQTHTRDSTGHKEEQEACVSRRCGRRRLFFWLHVFCFSFSIFQVFYTKEPHITFTIRKRHICTRKKKTQPKDNSRKIFAIHIKDKQHSWHFELIHIEVKWVSLWNGGGHKKASCRAQRADTTSTPPHGNLGPESHWSSSSG